MSKYICAGCGEHVEGRSVKGSMTHPYCRKCFKRCFNDSYEDYFKFLWEEHP